MKTQVEKTTTPNAASNNVWRVYGDLYIALNDAEVEVLAEMLAEDIAFKASGMKLD